MPRVLLLLTTQTYRARAFLAAAERMGVAAVVGSERPQVLQAAHPAGHLTLDFRDPGSATRAAVEFAARHPLDAVVAADDDGAVLAAEIAASLGLRANPPAAVRAARDKHLMRGTLAAAGIPGPRFARVPLGATRVAGALKKAGVPFPCVVKPLALSASRGVIRADDEAQLGAALRRVAAMLRGGADPGATHVLVEEYLPGDEVAVEGLLEQGRLRTLAIFDKPDPLEGPFFEETIYLTPSRLPEGTQGALQRMTAEVATALGLSQGPVHAELRVEGDCLRPLEIAPRSIGGLCSRALRFGDGLSLEELILRQALGMDASAEREGAASGVMMIPVPRSGVLAAVRGLEQARAIPHVEEVLITLPVGAEVVAWPEGHRYLGFIFARAERAEAVEAALRRAQGALHFEMRPTPAPA